MYILVKKLLPQLLSRWTESGTVYAPHADINADGQAILLPFNPEKSTLTLDYINFYQPVPDLAKPFTLFEWQEKDGQYTAQPAQFPAFGSTEHAILFGVRPCDCAALTVQDIFHLTEYIDPVYKALRETFTIVALNCLTAGEDCFCSSTESGPFTVSGADLVMTELEDCFLLEPVTARGHKLIESALGLISSRHETVLPQVKGAVGSSKSSQQSTTSATQGMKEGQLEQQGSFDAVVSSHTVATTTSAPHEQTISLLEPATAIHQEAKQTLLDKALTTFARTVDLTEVEEALEAQFDDELWKDITPTCISCSGCTQLCPTCTCFQVIEEATPSGGKRLRVKDSCQTEGFTRNAGWHNPRTHVDRVRYRFYDKLSYVGRRFGLSRSCTGCGRCITTCPAHIDIIDIAATIQKRWQEAGKPKALRMAPERYDKAPTHLDANLYTPRPAVITRIEKETSNINRYFIEYCDAPDEPMDLSGQFYMLTVFGVGEIAISIPFGDSPGTKMEFCIKATGKVTNALAELPVGSIIGLRGPYGRPFPMEAFKGKDVLVVGSGVGLAPVRTIIVQMFDNRQDFGKIAIIASATSYEGLIYKQDLIDWQNQPDTSVQYALARPTEAVQAHVGYINDLLPDLPFHWDNAVAILCASPRRIKAVASDLLALGLAPDAIYTSLETHMRCGVGKCGHCKVGSHYMCVDGPVFTYEEMLKLPPEY